MSLNADAAILLSGISGSWIQSTNRGTAPASTTACDSSVLKGVNFFKDVKVDFEGLIVHDLALNH